MTHAATILGYRSAGDPPPLTGANQAAPWLNAATSGVNIVGGYLNSEASADRRAQILAAQMTQAQAQAGQAVNSAEAFRILAIANAQIRAQDEAARNAPSTQTAIQPITTPVVPTQPPAQTSKAPLVIGALVLGGLGGLGAWWMYGRKGGR